MGVAEEVEENAEELGVSVEENPSLFVSVELEFSGKKGFEKRAFLLD